MPHNFRRCPLCKRYAAPYPLLHVEGNVNLGIPGKVAEAIIRHRKGIGEARKSDKARERAVGEAQGIVKGESNG